MNRRICSDCRKRPVAKDFVRIGRFLSKCGKCTRKDNQTLQEVTQPALDLATPRPKVNIILAYYNRPTLVRNALESIKRQSSSNWVLNFIDDGSPNPGRPIVEEILADHLDKITFHWIPDTLEQKIAQGGSRHGAWLNKSIWETDAEIVVVLCDDDALTEDCVEKLGNYYLVNPSVKWSYGHVVTFDPSKQKVPWGQRKSNTTLNRHKDPINPACLVDSSQVTFRKSCFDNDIGYPSPLTSGLDAHMFHIFFRLYGPCVFNGHVVQFKGDFADQMGSRPIESRFTPRVQ